MKITPPDIVQIISLLAETPPRIASAVSGLDHRLLNSKPDPNSWSVSDILAHLNACAEVWGTQIDQMLAQNNPTLRHISPRTWIRRTEFPTLTFPEGFIVFTDQREKLMDVLMTLEDEKWENSAVSKNRTHTVYSHARRMALHEQGHLEQIEAVVGAFHD